MMNNHTDFKYICTATCQMRSRGCATYVAATHEFERGMYKDANRLKLLLSSLNYLCTSLHYILFLSKPYYTKQGGKFVSIIMQKRGKNRTQAKFIHIIYYKTKYLYICPNNFFFLIFVLLKNDNKKKAYYLYYTSFH